MECLMIGIDELMPDSSQPRKAFVAEELDRLAVSIASRGMLMPIQVIWDGERKRYRIICGESRWHAARQAGLATVPCLVMGLDDEVSEVELLADQLTENSVRSDLAPLEFARAIARLKALRGCSSQELATEFGFSKASICRAEALLSLPVDIQNLVDAGRLSGSAAYELSRHPDEEGQRRLLAELLAGRLTRDQAAEVVRRKLKGNKAAKSRLPFKLGGVSLTVTAAQALSWKELADLIDRLKREIKRFTDGDGGGEAATPLKL